MKKTFLKIFAIGLMMAAFVPAGYAATPKVIFPDVIGKTLNEAKDLIAEAALKVSDDICGIWTATNRREQYLRIQYAKEQWSIKVLLLS